MAVERIEIDGLIIRGALLPTPKEDTDPFERQSAHGGLMRFPLVALLLVIDPRPEGMPNRFGCPLDERLPQELWALEAPVHPGLLPAAFGHRRNPRIFLQFGGGGIAFPLFAEGDEQPGGEDGACPWKGLEQGEIGMVMSALRDGVIKGLDCLQGDPELVDKGLDEQGMRGDNTLIGGQGDGGFDGVDALCNNVRRAHVVVAEEGFQRGAPGELHRFEGRPAAQKVTEDVGVFVLEPLEHLREIVLQGAREAVGESYFISDHAAAAFDELVERTHRGALRLEGLELVTMGEEQFELEFGVGGVVFGPAGGEGFTIPRQRQRIEGKEDQKVILAQGGDQGTLVEFEADSNGLAVEPRAQRADPYVDSLGRVLEDEALSFCGSSSLETNIMFGIRPVDTHKGSKCFV